MSKIGKVEWLFVYLVAGIIDFIQFFLPGIGLISDFAIGVLFVAYFQFRGVSLIKHHTRLASLLGVGIFETITFGVAPAWIMDIWYIHRTVRKENAKYNKEKSEKELPPGMIEPLYDGNGVRRPRKPENEDISRRNVNGIRLPNGGLR